MAEYDFGAFQVALLVHEFGLKLDHDVLGRHRQWQLDQVALQFGVALVFSVLRDLFWLDLFPMDGLLLFELDQVDGGALVDIEIDLRDPLQILLLDGNDDLEAIDLVGIVKASDHRVASRFQILT